MINKKGFTLAEVLITLAIIGVVAAIAIPSVISNSQQQEFKTGLRKAVSVLNSAITMNMAIDGESPYDNTDLYNYLQRHMNILKKTNILSWSSYYVRADGKRYDSGKNGAFYTVDGIRFEFDDSRNDKDTGDMSGELLKLHESNVNACFATISTATGTASNGANLTPCGGCGSYGPAKNPNQTTKPPCATPVDVNGDRKPSPGNINCNTASCAIKQNVYKVPLADEKKLSDIFVVLITDKKTIPYGVTAQRAIYQRQK